MDAHVRDNLGLVLTRTPCMVPLGLAVTPDIKAAR
jgi:hypothetical protein